MGPVRQIYENICYAGWCTGYSQRECHSWMQGQVICPYCQTNSCFVGTVVAHYEW